MLKSLMLVRTSKLTKELYINSYFQYLNHVRTATVEQPFMHQNTFIV